MKNTRRRRKNSILTNKINKIKKIRSIIGWKIIYHIEINKGNTKPHIFRLYIERESVINRYMHTYLGSKISCGKV